MSTPRGSVWLRAGVVAALAGVVMTVLRSIPSTSDPLAMVTAFSPYALLAYGPALVLLVVAVARARRRAAPAVVLVVVLVAAVYHLSWIVPRYVDDDRPTAGPSFTLVTVNLLKGAADPDSLVAAGDGADVVVLTEVTGAALAAVDDRGWATTYPYRQEGLDLPQKGSGGTAVLSRYPLSDTQVIDRRSNHQNWLVTLAVPGGKPITLAAVHPSRPYPDGLRWWSDQQYLREALAGHRPDVVAGDFNAVADHRSMRLLAEDGLVDAVDLAGAGWVPTYPATGKVPALVGIDHVLLAPTMTATDAESVIVSDTDHHGLRTVLFRT